MCGWLAMWVHIMPVSVVLVQACGHGVLRGPTARLPMALVTTPDAQDKTTAACESHAAEMGLRPGAGGMILASAANHV